MEEFEYLNELQVAAEKLIQSYGFRDMVTLFLKWVVSFAAIVVMILDRTKWKSTNMFTSLLAPYLFVSLPLVIFQFFRTEFGKWIALVTVVLRLFLPNKFHELAESLEIPSATLLLILAAPNDIVESFRDNLRMRDVANVCLFTSCYLLDKHTKACGGYKNSFTQKDKITCTICLYLLLVYPVWSTFAYLF
uniref:Cold-regulated 413 plasma membrane protein 2 n=1 Tax=Noccaea caerulescens TaxID=107243 RepID=A0A1J3JFI1_NOCCA